MLKVLPKKSVLLIPGTFRLIVRAAIRGEIRDGDAIKCFEKEFARYIGARYALSSASARYCLYALLKSIDMNGRNEVIVPAYTFKPVVDTVIMAGLKPVFVDIERQGFGIDPKLLENRVTRKTGALIAAHLFGQCCSIKAIKDICRKEGIFLIEDCAHSPGAETDGRKAGSFGDAAIFSFGVTKPFNTFDGGMVTVNCKRLYSRIKALIEKGDSLSHISLFKKVFRAYAFLILTHPLVYIFFEYPLFCILNIFRIDYLSLYKLRPEPFKNYLGKFTNIQAVLGLKLLSELDRINAKRAENAKLLVSLVKTSIDVPLFIDDSSPICFLIPIICRDRSKERAAQKYFFRGLDLHRSFMQNCPPIFGVRLSYPVADFVDRHLLLLHLRHNATYSDIRYAASRLLS